MPAPPIDDRRRARRLVLVVMAMGMTTLPSRAADFLALCEANQVYDTGKPTTDDDHRLCHCIQRRLDAKGERAAVEVFQKVLAARRAGLGLHPSQVDFDELVALMSFSDGLAACGAGRAAF